MGALNTHAESIAWLQLGERAVILLMLASIIGGVTTAILFSQHGFLLAALAAPFGGSMFALLAALYLAARRPVGCKAAPAGAFQADEAVAY